MIDERIEGMYNNCNIDNLHEFRRADSDMNQKPSSFKSARSNEQIFEIATAPFEPVQLPMFENDACDEFQQYEPLPCQAADMEDDPREYTYSGSDDTNVDQFFYEPTNNLDALEMRPSISFSTTTTIRMVEESSASSLSQTDPSSEDEDQNDDYSSSMVATSSPMQLGSNQLTWNDEGTNYQPLISREGMRKYRSYRDAAADRLRKNNN